MSKEREALKIALEALEVASSCVDGYYIPIGKSHLPEVEQAIAAIREALAQPEQIPPSVHSNTHQPEQEPKHVATVAEVHMSRYTIEWTNGPLPEGTKLYTTPPQRTWVGLTDEEYTEMWGKKPDLLNFFRQIEAKLKEKNA